MIVETSFKNYRIIDLMIHPESVLESEMSVYASAFRALTLSEFKLSEVHFEQ
jgi:hypothetical protein